MGERMIDQFQGDNIEHRNTAREDWNEKYFHPLKNCRCPNDCYFVKVKVSDYEKLKPRCPYCNEEMLTKEDRKKGKEK